MGGAIRSGADHASFSSPPSPQAFVRSAQARWIEPYPVQRQRLPLIAWRKPASLGSWPSSPCIRYQHIETMKPGVQKPHCAPPCFTIAS